MRRIKREIETREAVSSQYNKSQASLNSDGCLTIRNYNEQNKSVDEILILNRKETQAILDLFNHLGCIQRQQLPF